MFLRLVIGYEQLCALSLSHAFRVADIIISAISIIQGIQLKKHEFTNKNGKETSKHTHRCKLLKFSISLLRMSLKKPDVVCHV